MKTIRYTYEQISGIVNNLNRIQVTGLEQARILTMIGLLLDQGEQAGEDRRPEETERGAGEGGKTDEAEGHS